MPPKFLTVGSKHNLKLRTYKVVNMLILTRKPNLIKYQKECRHFWGWINYIFNRVDEQRIKTVGPDRACAEWLLRNGAAVKWINSEDYLKDYNSLPVEGTKRYIKEVDATESSIMHYGFRHFRGCKHIDKIILNQCSYLENEALPDLSYIKETLVHLQISSCGNITSSGLYSLVTLQNLKILDISNLLYIMDKETVLQKLKSSLPNCNITFK